MGFVTPTNVTVGSVLTASKYNQEVVENILVSPRGVLGKHTLTTGFATSSTHTNAQDTGLTTPVTYEANRTLKITCASQYFPSGGLQAIELLMVRGTTPTVIATFSMAGAALDAGVSNSFTHVALMTTGASGATETFKTRIRAVTNNTAVNQFGNATFGRFLIIEDIGPA